MKKLFIFLFSFISLITQSFSKRYTYVTYQQAIEKIQQLSENYPRYVKLFDAKTENEHIFDTQCGSEPCKHWYLQISDFEEPQEKLKKLPQVFLLAGIHGDEVIGVNTLLYLAEYLMQKNGVDEHITNLIKTRMLILLPLANPSGFYYNQRGEKQATRSIDPNRDFPYNLPDNKCLVTASARVINHIFRKYLIQAAVTFHGGERSITYPWGAFNHIKKGPKGEKADESPDDQAFLDIANILSREAGSNPVMFIDPYPTGRMTDIVYAVNGGLEDWSYGASWETQFSPNVIPTCDGLPASETTYNALSLRSLVYLVEASFPKQPPEAYLGASEGLEPYGDKTAFGHIPMNIKLSLAFIDIVEPYVKIKSLDYSEENKTLTVQWQGGGCKTVDSTGLQYGNTVKGGEVEMKLPVHYGPGYHENKDFIFQEIIDLKNIDFNLNILIELTCDQKWSQQTDPNPNTTPVTHFVQARTNQDYFVETDEYSISGKQIVHYNLTGLTKEYLLKTRTINPRSIVLMMEVVDCSAFNKIGTITSQITGGDKALALQYDGKFNIKDISLEGRLYQYGDISRCKSTIGAPLNNKTFQADSGSQNSLLFKVKSSKSETTTVDYKAPLVQEQDILQFIGRSVLLENDEQPEQLYVGQILPYQPDSCTKDKEMTGCVGFDLRSRDGVCIVRMNLNPEMHDFKLYIDTSDNENHVKISGFVPNSVLAQNENFGELVIVNEKIKEKFIINKGLVEGAGFIEQANFLLHSNIALGNVLRVYREKAGEMVLLGDCAISLQDPNINETQYYAENYNNIEDKVKFDLRMVLLAVLAVLFLLMGLFMIRVIRMQRKLREELGSRGTIIPDSAVATGEGQGTHKHVEFVESEDIEAEV